MGPPRMTGVRVSPVWFVLVGIGSVQFGAAIAKDLFGIVSPTSMVWLRLVASAVVLTAMAHPRLRGRDRIDWLAVLGLGVSLGVMNWSIYQSFARIPLGIAVTIEFVGPLAVAVLGSRRARDLVWVGLAGLGVVLLGTSDRGVVTLAGVALALVAGAAWAAYILSSAQTGRRWPGLEGLAVASVVAALLLTPAALVRGGSTLLDPRVLLIGAAVGLLSSVVPYSLEMAALRRMKPAVFSVLMSLEPAAAALAAALLLREYLSPVQLLAMACVVAASVGATRRTPEQEASGESTPH